MLASHILKYPLTSEKAVRLEKSKQFIFVVSGLATKGQIKTAFQQLYGVVPSSVNVSYLPAKHRSKDNAKTRARQKKAVITISEKTKVDLQHVKEYRAKVK